jgi:hypothetical protein
MPRAPRLRLAPEALAWGAVPLAGLVWVLAHLPGTYFFDDEWSLIGRVLDAPDAWSASFDGFNGHLIFVSFWTYWVQLRLFGLDGHTFVYLVFAFSLVAMHVSLAALLRAAGAPGLVAVLGAGLVVYFGVGSQNMVFEFQLAWNLAYTTAFVAAVVALRWTPSRLQPLFADRWRLPAVGAVAARLADPQPPLDRTGQASDRRACSARHVCCQPGSAQFVPDEFQRLQRQNGSPRRPVDSGHHPAVRRRPVIGAGCRTARQPRPADHRKPAEPPAH